MTIKADKDQTIATYDKTAKTHSEKFKKYGARVDDIELAFSYITKENPKVVDIGCGDGRDAVEILKRTNDYLGIDLSIELLNIAKQRVPNGTFELSDFETYEYPENIDIAILFASVLHSDKESVRNLIEKLNKSLSSDGVIFISTKYGAYTRTVIDRGGPKVNYLYTPEDIAAMSPPGLKKVHEQIQDIRDQTWFTIILQKQQST